MGNQDKYSEYIGRIKDGYEALYMKHSEQIFSPDFMRDLLDMLEPFIDEGNTLLRANPFEHNTIGYWQVQDAIDAMKNLRADTVYMLSDRESG